MPRHKSHLGQLSWVNPGGQRSPPQLLTRSPAAGWGRIRWVKVQKLVGWGKESLTGKAQAMRASKAKGGIPSLLPILPIAGRRSATPGTAGLHHASRWRGKTKSHRSKRPRPPSAPAFIAERGAIWSGVSLGQWGLAVPPPSPSCPPSLLAGGAGWGTEKTLMLRKHRSLSNS